MCWNVIKVPRKFELGLAASDKSPIIDEAFILKGCGNNKATVNVKEGVDYRVGYEKELEGVDSVLWFECELQKPERLLVRPAIQGTPILFP